MSCDKELSFVKLRSVCTKCYVIFLFSSTAATFIKAETLALIDSKLQIFVKKENIFDNMLWKFWLALFVCFAACISLGMQTGGNAGAAWAVRVLLEENLSWQAAQSGKRSQENS